MKLGAKTKLPNFIQDLRSKVVQGSFEKEILIGFILLKDWESVPRLQCILACMASHVFLEELMFLLKFFLDSAHHQE